MTNSASNPPREPAKPWSEVLANIPSDDDETPLGALLERSRRPPADAVPPRGRYSRADILDQTKVVVSERSLNYGKPEDNFQRIAALWNTHLLNRFADHAPLPVLTPQDVSMMMIMVKLGRLENSPNHFDSWLDIIGYGACGGELADQENT